MDWSAATVTIGSPLAAGVPVRVLRARTDDDVMELFIPAHLADEMELPFVQNRRVNRHGHSGEGRNPWPSEARSVGVSLTAWGRTTWCEALVHGDEIVLGWQPRLSLVHDDMPTIFSHGTTMDPGLRRDDEQV